MSQESMVVNCLADDIQDRVEYLVKQAFHYKRLGAITRFTRTKNELETLVRKHGVDIMSPTFTRYGYTPDAPNPRKDGGRNLVMNKECA